MSKGDSNQKAARRIICLTLAAVIMTAAIFLCWWFGLFLPSWIQWQHKEFEYADTAVSLDKGKLSLLQEGARLYQTNPDWRVQDVLCFDINRDGQEELILLVWKHGSYGKHLPMWVKHNDIRLEQHIFIYQRDKSRSNGLKPVWMSSALGYEVLAIEEGEQGRLIITNRNDCSRAWQWQDFGLKLIGEVRKEQVRFVCAGDNLIHPRILKYSEDNYDYFYENIKKEIEGADLAAVNQETIFVKERGLVSDFPRFGTPTQVGDALLNAGFDIITLANNHVLDKGIYGIETTTSFYARHRNVICIGVHPEKEAAENAEAAVSIIEKNGISIALLNDTYGTNGMPMPEDNPYLVERLQNQERLVEQLDFARKNADVVIMFVHWGTEYSNEIDEEQKRLSVLFLQHGVDVVIGTHPHVLQPYEVLTGSDGHQMLIYYSLGNLISGQDRAECMIGGLAEFSIVKDFNGEIRIADYALEKVVTHQDESSCTVYLLKEYSKELAEKNKVKGISYEKTN